MAKDKLTEYDATANNNTVVGDVNLAENSALPSDMNNAVREIMSHQKEAFGAGTPLYVDQTNNRVGINKTPTVALDVNGALTQDGGAVFNEGGADVDFRVESDTVTHALFVDGANGNVGISESAPLDKLHVYEVSNSATATQLLLQNEGGNNHSAGIAFQVSSSGETTAFAPKAGIVFERTAANGGGRLKFFNDAANDASGFSAGDERMRIHNNGVVSATGGVALGVGTANTASNVLDDYEQGTWTAELRGGDARASTPVISTTATYVKTGRSVFVQAYFPNVNTTGASGTMTITGLPFTAINSLQLVNCLTYGMDYDDSTAVMGIAFYIENNNNANLIAAKDNAAWQATSITAGTGKYVAMTGTYYTNS